MRHSRQTYEKAQNSVQPQMRNCVRREDFVQKDSRSRRKVGTLLRGEEKEKPSPQRNGNPP